MGGAERATILHYIENDQRLEQGDLVLVDAGCELGGYASDITRTWPVGGTFSPAQRDLYESVLSIQQALIEAVRPGVSWQEIQDLNVRLSVEALRSLGVLDGEIDEQIERGTYKQYVPHSFGHWLGLDVHDVGRYYGQDRASRHLEQGIILTIEPGLYIRADHEGAPEALRGHGVRIEDNILVTSDGHENLTHACPKMPDQIETIVGQGVALSPTPR